MSTYTPEQIEATLARARPLGLVSRSDSADKNIERAAAINGLIPIIEQLRAENARLHKREDAIRALVDKSDCASPIEADEIYAILDGEA